MKQRHIWVNTLIFWCLAAYIIIGMSDVPFHGDESTTIWMSRDFDTLILHHDFDAVAYAPPATRTTEQHLRVITANFSKFWMGLAWWSAGYDVEQINDQWVWSPDLDITWNQANGHMPSAALLWWSRLSSTLMTILSVALIFGITRRITQHWWRNNGAILIAAWGAAMLYVINPIVLINGRRAMFEGGLLLMLALVAWWSLNMVQQVKSISGWHFLILGVLTGIAFTTKHSSAFTVVPIYTALLGTMLLRRNGQQVVWLAISGTTALAIMLLLSPLWWASPLEMPSVTYTERRSILDLQVELFGGYTSFDESVRGFIEHGIIINAPQYYEAGYWADFDGVAAEIDTYERSLVAGWWHPLVSAARLVLLAAGIWALLRQWRITSTWIVVSWLGGVAILTFITVPLGWQRYYLPLQLPLAITMGIGMGTIWQYGRQQLAF